MTDMAQQAIDDSKVERQFVAALLRSPDRLDSTTVSIHHLNDRHAILAYNAAIIVYSQGRPVTPTSVREALRDIPSAISGRRAKPDEGWLDSLLETPLPEVPPIDEWERDVLARSARRAAAVAAGERQGPRSPDPHTPIVTVEDDPAMRWTELGNARRLAREFGAELRHVAERGEWLAWDGIRWCRDSSAPMVRAKAVVRKLFGDAAALAARAAAGEEVGGAAEAAAKWARTSSKAASLAAMITLAKSEPQIAATADMFDVDHFALNCINGTVDLRTGKLHPHRAEDMHTRLAPVRYDANARAPRWDAFLERVLPDVEVRGWLQRYLGYSLTGDVGEQCLAFMFGCGANGKSVLVDVVLELLGDYAIRAAPDLVLNKAGESHPTEQADLEGRRLVVCSEIEQGRQWAESMIKRITGDATITARKMRQDFYSFVATHKLIVCANTKPVVKGTDHAIWRRMNLVPFGVTIPEGERDKHLVRKLVDEESSGILAWLVEGCLAWQRAELGDAPAIREATEHYRADQDVLGHWLSDCCVLLPGVWTPGASLYESYRQWCHAAGQDPWTWESVRARLLERAGVTESKRNHGRVRGLAGIGLQARGDAE